MKISFCSSELDIGAYLASNEDFRRRLALLEVLGLPYYHALKKQGLIHGGEIDCQILKILEEEEKKDA